MQMDSVLVNNGSIFGTAALPDRKPLSTRQLRVLWLATVVLTGIYALLAEKWSRTNNGLLTSKHWAIVALGAWTSWSGYSLRRKLVRRASAAASRGDELAASRKWSAAQLVAISSSQAVALWGLVASMSLGCPRWFYAMFFGTGLLLLILWRPMERPSSV